MSTGITNPALLAEVVQGPATGANAIEVRQPIEGSPKTVVPGHKDVPDETPKPKRPKIDPKRIIAELLREGALFFVNTKNEPVIFLPETPFQKYWPAGHDRVQVYLAAVYFDLSDGEFLKSSDLAAIIALLKDACYKGGRRLTEIESPETEKNPIVQGMLCLMNSSDSFKGMTATLLSKLNEVDIVGKIQGFEVLPALTSIFSRRLNRLIPSLRGLGIDVSIWHEEDGSHCSVKRLPSFVREADALSRQSSVDSSGVNAERGKDFCPTDGTDGTERFDDIPAKPTEVQSVEPIVNEPQDLETDPKGGAT